MYCDDSNEIQLFYKIEISDPIPDEVLTEPITDPEEQKPYIFDLLNAFQTSFMGKSFPLVDDQIPMGSDIAYIPEKKIACIDLTSYYEDDEHPETEADLCDFIDMFTDGYTSDQHGGIETSEEDEILATGDYEDDDDVQRKYDIDRCLECARQNVRKLQDMIEAVERAKAQGATKFAAIDFNDYDGDCDDD